MAKKTFYAICLSSITILSGCSVVGNKVISDNTLKEKAAFTLGTTTENIVLSNRRPSEADAIKFDVTAKGKQYQCYITTVMGAISSDAVCNEINSSSNKHTKPVCNALLKKAGKC